MTKVLGKSDLLGQNLKRELVYVPALDASLWMQQMNAGHTIEFKKYIDQYRTDGKKETSLEQDIEIMTLVISFSACDEEGNLLFTQEEAKGLTKNNLNVLLFLGNKALTISGLNVGANGFGSEVADNLPNDLRKSSSATLRVSSRKRGKKS